MNYFSWLAQEAELSNAALTVLAQAVSPNDQDQLVWDVFFPRRNVDSLEINTISDVSFRPTADRREWNTRGRLIPLVTPETAKIEMLPIESYFKIEEQEINKLLTRVMNDQALFRRLIGADIPSRVRSLTEANYRRIEVDAMTAWALGQVTVKDPQTGDTTVVGFDFDAARYQTAGTAWSDAGVNAYDEFLAWLQDAQDAMGAMPSAAVMRLATYRAIQADAPQGADAIMLTRSQLVQRVQDDIGSAFNFLINERHVDVFTDGGIVSTPVKVWPAEVIAAVPQGDRVGETAFAPVVRAYEAAAQAPKAGVDVNGMTAYTEVGNGGRELTVECQVNALSIPNEQKVFVIDVGV